jgi:uncharacterized glyoxalase superfamily protein PhnB
MTDYLEAIHPVLQARDVSEMVEFYRSLGFVVVFQDAQSGAKYVGLERNNLQLHIQWADDGQWAYPIDRPAFRFLVSDVDKVFDELVASGAVRSDTTNDSPWARPKETPWGTREFHLRDPSKNSLQFYQPTRSKQP